MEYREKDNNMYYWKATAACILLLRVRISVSCHPKSYGLHQYSFPRYSSIDNQCRKKYHLRGDRAFPPPSRQKTCMDAGGGDLEGFLVSSSKTVSHLDMWQSETSKNDSRIHQCQADVLSESLKFFWALRLWQTIFVSIVFTKEFI